MMLGEIVHKIIFGYTRRLLCLFPYLIGQSFYDCIYFDKGNNHFNWSRRVYNKITNIRRDVFSVLVLLFT